MFKYVLIIIFLVFNFSYTNSINAQENNTQISDSEETNFFHKSPRLVRAITTYTLTNVNSSYIFEIEIPKEAKANLQTIVINQQKNVEIINLFPEKTQAFIINGKEQEILVNTTLNTDNDQNILTINLTQPVPAGYKVRIKVRSKNPLYSGVYQFGVTVFPQSNQLNAVNNNSLYLGIGRFNFYRSGGMY